MVINVKARKVHGILVSFRPIYIIPYAVQLCIYEPIKEDELCGVQAFLLSSSAFVGRRMGVVSKERK